MATDDLLTLAEAKMYVSIGMGDNVKDDLLRSWVTGASRVLVSKVGTIINGSITAELHSGGRPYVYLDCKPIKAISQVVEYDGLTGEALYKAVYSDVSIGFIAEQVAKHLSDWSNFQRGSQKP